jgi:hypothetical protein
MGWERMERDNGLGEGWKGEGLQGQGLARVMG